MQNAHDLNFIVRRRSIEYNVTALRKRPEPWRNSIYALADAPVGREQFEASIRSRRYRSICSVSHCSNVNAAISSRSSSARLLTLNLATAFRLLRRLDYALDAVVVGQAAPDPFLEEPKRSPHNLAGCPVAATCDLFGDEAIEVVNEGEARVSRHVEMVPKSSIAYNATSDASKRTALAPRLSCGEAGDSGRSGGAYASTQHWLSTEQAAAGHIHVDHSRAQR